MENQMRSAFWKQAEEWVKTLSPVHKNEVHVANVGAECELFLYKSDGTMASDSEKRLVMSQAHCSYELGAWQVELNPGPVDIGRSSVDAWYEQLSKYEKDVKRAAESNGLLLGRCGTVPWVKRNEIKVTDVERYHQVPSFHDRHRPLFVSNKVGGVQVGGASVVSLFNAFQFTLEAYSADDAVDKLNRLLMISPMAVALGANASWLFGNKTSWQDLRFEAWRLSHDIRNVSDRLSGKSYRVGLPERYYSTIDDCLKDAARYPFILNDESNALRIGLGLLWRDARVKALGTGKVGVEFRPLSTQKSLKDDMALAIFVIGRLLYSQNSKESLQPMAWVAENKYQAERFGLDGYLIDAKGQKRQTSKILKEELGKACKGINWCLELLSQFSSKCMWDLDARLERGVTPADEIPEGRQQQIEYVRVK